MAFAIQQFGMSERQACKLVNLDRSSYRYEPMPDHNAELREELVNVARQKPRSMHPTKTKVVYCKSEKRRGKYPNVQFDFLGYCFRPRLVRSFRDNALFCGFNPAVSGSAMNAMRETIRDLNLRRKHSCLYRTSPASSIRSYGAG